MLSKPSSRYMAKRIAGMPATKSQIEGALVACMLAIALISFYFTFEYDYKFFALIGGVTGTIAILTNPRAGVYLLAFIIPLQYFVRTDSGGTAIKYLGLGIFAIWLLRKLVSGASFSYITGSPIVKICSTFLLIALASGMWAANWSAWQVRFFTFFQLLGMLVLLIDTIRTEKHLEFLLAALTLGTVVSAISAIHEYMDDPTWDIYSRATGGFGDGNFSSASYLFVMPFAFLILQRPGIKRWFGIVILLILVVGTVASVSRTGILALILFALLLLNNDQKSKNKLFYMILVMSGILFLSPILPLENIVYRFSRITTGDSNTDFGGRAIRIAALLPEILSRPILGTGLGRQPTMPVAHNQFIQIGVELGFPGMLILIWLWCFSWITLSNVKRRCVVLNANSLSDIVSMLRLSFILYLFFSLSLSNESSRTLWVLFSLVAIVDQLTKPEGLVAKSYRLTTTSSVEYREKHGTFRPM